MMGIILCSLMAIQGAPQGKGSSEDVALKVVCNAEFENLANQLVSNFRNDHAGTRVQVLSVGNGDIYSSLGKGSVALVTKECVSGESMGSCFSMVVGRDALVPVMNAANPLLDYILEHGISPEEFSAIYTDQRTTTWGEVLGCESKQEVHAYLPEGAGNQLYLAEFLQSGPGDLKGMGLLGNSGMTAQIAQDPFAIGFCSLAYLTGNEEGWVDAHIALVPVDADGNGLIGTFEDIYQSGTMLSHAVYVGRFPKALYSRIYAVTREQPGDDITKTFMEWLVNGGQEAMALAGFLELGRGERIARLEQLSASKPVISSVPIKSSVTRIFLVIAGILLLGAAFIIVLAQRAGRKKPYEAEGSFEGTISTGFPGGLFFDRSHTWTYMEKDGQVRIGIDSFLQELTGPLTRVIMRQPGEQIKRNEYFLTLIQNGKRLQIKSPVTGIIREQNEQVLKKASLLNTEPYDSGWLLLVEPLNWVTELKSFFLGARYTDWLKREGARVKEFFSSLLKLEDAKDQALVLQDGGEIRPGLLEQFGPEVWVEFQEGYINSTN
jgi:glycine cleavage system H lipoate-binding protein/ABC-type phosphate transport system substrate-binding protein